MEKLEHRTPEEKTACNRIMYQRRYGRIMHKRKTITNIIDNINGYKLCSNTCIEINKSTGGITVSSYLRHRGTIICPTTHQKLRCTNQHALDVLRKQKKRMLRKNYEVIHFCDTLEPYIYFIESIYLFKDTGRPFYSSRYYTPNQKTQLKLIKEIDTQEEVSKQPPTQTSITSRVNKVI